MNIKYNSYTFPRNPYAIYMQQQGLYVRYIIPYGGQSAQYLGEKKRVIQLKGSFYGDDALSQYEALESFYNNARSGLLTLSENEQLSVYFSSLKKNITAGRNTVDYEAEFMEV